MHLSALILAGRVTISGGLVAKYFTIPNTAGLTTEVKGKYSKLTSNNYIMTQLQNNVQILTDQLTAKMQESKQTAAIVTRSAQTDFSTGDFITFQVRQADPANTWSTQNSKFTLAADGYYTVTVSLSISGTSATAINLFYNGTNVAVVYSGTPGVTPTPIAYTFQYAMGSGDTLWLTAGGPVTVGGDKAGISNQFALRW